MNADGSDQTNISQNAATDTAPAWSPDGTHILFVSDRDGNKEIYKMDASGANQTRLTNNPARDVAPSWTSDGRIVFERGGATSRPATQERMSSSCRPRAPESRTSRTTVRCHVPRVIGLRLARAKARIQSKHCSVGRIRRAHSRRVGRVISQHPRPGSVRPRGFPVRLVVGRR